jgi:hypothetical protein
MAEIEIVTEWPAGWLTATEAAGRRGVDRATVSRWARAGLRAVRVVVNGVAQLAVEPAALDAYTPARRGAPVGNQHAAGARRKKTPKRKR